MNDPFESFKKYAFRLELLQQYLVPEEEKEFEEFKKTGTCDNSEFEKYWIPVIERAHQRGAQMSRVHIIEAPLSDYLRFEIEGYKISQAAGEKVYFLSKKDWETIRNPIDHDFWLFDDELVLTMNYDHSGKFIGNKQITDNVEGYVELKNLLLDSSKNFQDYLK